MTARVSKKNEASEESEYTFAALTRALGDISCNKATEETLVLRLPATVAGLGWGWRSFRHRLCCCGRTSRPFQDAEID